MAVFVSKLEGHISFLLAAAAAAAKLLHSCPTL